MNKIYYISSCSTCKRILGELNLSQYFEYQDIKQNPILENELDTLKKDIGSYQLLFNKRSRLYKERNLKDQNLTENDYKKLMLEHYSFIKRPIFVIEGKVITGNATKIINEIRKII